jgi:hypothetical protein
MPKVLLAVQPSLAGSAAADERQVFDLASKLAISVGEVQLAGRAPQIGFLTADNRR